MHRACAVAVVVALVLTGCTGSRLSLSEYSDRVATLVETLDSRLDAHAERYFSGPPSVEGMLEYLDVRVAGYREIVEGAEAIDPPEEVVDLHDTFREIMEKLLVAEEARADFAATIDSVDELDLVWEGPAGQAVSAAEAEAIVLCHAAQSRFDETQDRSAFADVPWMPSELKEVVRVALDCP